MPLIKGKSAKPNLEAEMEADKPKDLAIAYNMKKQSGKRMSLTGETIEMDKPASIVEAIRRKKAPVEAIQPLEDLEPMDELDMLEDSAEEPLPVEPEEPVSMDMISSIRRRMKTLRK